MCSLRMPIESRGWMFLSALVGGMEGNPEFCFISLRNTKNRRLRAGAVFENCAFALGRAEVSRSVFCSLPSL